MKIEDITPQRSKENVSYKKKGYWFPRSKGYKRLLIVLACLIVVCVECVACDDEEDFIGIAILTFTIELIIYAAIVWVYRGFNDSSD